MSTRLEAYGPVFSNAEGTSIDMMVQVYDTDRDGIEKARFPHPVAFTATPFDSEQHGRDLYDLALSGKLGQPGAYVPPTTTEEGN